MPGEGSYFDFTCGIWKETQIWTNLHRGFYLPSAPQAMKWTFLAFWNPYQTESHVTIIRKWLKLNQFHAQWLLNMLRFDTTSWNTESKAISLKWDTGAFNEHVTLNSHRNETAMANALHKYWNTPWASLWMLLDSIDSLSAPFFDSYFITTLLHVSQKDRIWCSDPMEQTSNAVWSPRS